MSDNTVYKTNRLLKISLTSFLRFVVLFPISFIVIPIMLSKLGTNQYGLWALVSAFSAYVQSSDLGIGFALVKSVAEMKAKDDYQRMRSILSTAFWLYSFLATIIIIIGFVFVKSIAINIFKIPTILLSDALYIFKWTILLYSVNLIFGMFTSILNGIQRMDVSNYIGLTTAILNSIGIIIFLLFNMGLKGLIINNAITIVITTILSIIFINRVDSKIKFSVHIFDFSEVKGIIKYGANIQITNIAGFAGDPMIRAIISHFGGLTSVASFEIAMRLINPIRSLFSQMISPLMPYAAFVNTNSDSRELMYVFRLSSRYIFLICFPIIAILLIFIHSFINIWIGPNYSDSSLTVQILLVGQFVSILSFPCYYVLLSSNVHVTMYLSIINALLNLVICICLGSIFGYFGTIIGFSSVILILSLISIFVFCKIYQIPMIQYLQTFSLKVVIIVFCLSMIFITLIQLMPFINIYIVLLFSVCFLFIYMIFLIRYNILTLMEKNKIKTKFISYFTILTNLKP